MPHKCTHCEKIFEDGSPEILKGCPACGGKKFLYVREEDPPRRPGGRDAGPCERKQTPPALLGTIEELGGDRETVWQQTVPVRPAHKEREKDIFDRLESISINGPGSSEINIEENSLRMVDLCSGWEKRGNMRWISSRWASPERKIKNTIFDPFIQLSFPLRFLAADRPADRVYPPVSLLSSGHPIDRVALCERCNHT